MTKIILSKIPKIWIIDIDGVIFPHNHFLNPEHVGKEKPLPGIKKLFRKIDAKDRVIIMTARNHKYRKYTQKMLKRFGIRCDLLLTDMPRGERILINDIKVNGLKTAYGLNLKRDRGLKDIEIYLSESKNVK